MQGGLGNWVLELGKCLNKFLAKLQNAINFCEVGRLLYRKRSRKHFGQRRQESQSEILMVILIGQGCVEISFRFVKLD